ncbi:MAG: holo-ACP synthase [Pseudomonadota bacterium]
MNKPNVHLGIDIVDVERIRTAVKRSAEGFLTRVYTAHERDYIGDAEHNSERAAGLWAAKEAAVKALGTGFRNGILFHDLEVHHEELGRPYFVFSGCFLAQMQQYGLTAASLSISHCGTHAVAAVVLG